MSNLYGTVHFLAQGRDREGRGMIIVKVANHNSKERDLRQMKSFSTYIMEAMVRGRRSGGELFSLLHSSCTGPRAGSLVMYMQLYMRWWARLVRQKSLIAP